MSYRKLIPLFIVVLCTLYFVLTTLPFCLAQSDWPKPTAQATRVEGKVSIDGKLDDAAWASAPWQSEFTSASAGPENSGPPKRVAVQTRFKVLYDGSALYIGAECDEPMPEKMRREVTEHDGMVFGDDCIELFFDPAGEGRYYHHYVLNTKGAWYDDYNADYGLVHGKLWDSVIETASQVDVAGKKWTVEARLPFGGLVLQSDVKPTWAWNISRERYAGGALELSSWSPLKGNFHLPKLFGKLTGLNVDFRRFALTVGEPHVSVSGGGSGFNSLELTVKVKNETGEAKALAGSAMLFGAPESKVAAGPVSLAAGAEGEVAFPALRVRAGDEANVVLAFTDTATGDVLKSVVKRLSADYRPITLTVLKPCYRNCIFATEKLDSIEFRVALAEDVAGRAAAVTTALSAADGTTVAESKAATGDLTQPLKLAADDLKVGSYKLVARALDAEGKVLAATETTIRKLPPPEAGNEVRIDELGNVLVNGKPFVAIGWYGGVNTDDPRADVVALQNMQTPAVPNLPDVSSISKPYAEHDIYSVASVENGRFYFTFNLWRDPKDTIHTELTKLTTPSAEMIGYVWKYLDAVKGQPGLVGYYIADEPEINNARSDYLENYYKLLCELDPYHPVIVTNDTQDGLVTHGFKNADILSPDPYSPEFDYVPNFMKRCHEVLRPGQTIWVTPWASSGQAHFTTDYGTDPPYPYKVFRNQYLVSLAFGARGWTGYTSSFFMPEIEYRYGLPYVWREVKFLEQAMAAPPPAEPLKIEADTEMTGWVRSVAGKLYVIVVNHKPGAREAKISHPLLKGLDKLIVMSEGREVEVRDGVIADHFAEGDARIYTTDPAAREFPTTKAVEAELAQRQKDSAKPGNLLHVSHGTRAMSSDGWYAPWFSQFYYYAINGITDDIGWQASHAAEDKPAWLELALKQPASIGRVVIYTPNLKDYDIQFTGPNGEVHVAEVRGNEKTVAEHNFQPPVPCLKLRVTSLPIREGKRQITEIEAYETPGAGAVTPVIEKAAAITAPQGVIPAATAGPNALWSEDFTNFTSREKYYWDGKDGWVANPQTHKVTPKAGGGLVCSSPNGGSGMSRIWPYDSAYRFFQVNISAIEGKGYRFVNVGFGNSSGKPGYRGAVNSNRPGIYTVDTHYVHESFNKGTAKDCFVTTYMGAIQTTFDWMRLVKRPVDGLAVMMADGSPLPTALKQGDELLFQLLLDKSASDATVDVMTDSYYGPLQINGEPYVQLVKIGAKDGREWAGRVKLGPGTGKFDQAKAGYPVVFRANVSGGAIKETFASATVSFN